MYKFFVGLRVLNALSKIWELASHTRREFFSLGNFDFFSLGMLLSSLHVYKFFVGFFFSKCGIKDVKADSFSLSISASFFLLIRESSLYVYKFCVGFYV